MNNRGVVLALIGFILLGILVILFGVGIYLYNFHVFETVRVCVGDSTDAFVSCDSIDVCLSYFESYVDLSYFDGAPDFLSSALDDVVSRSVYCDSTCFVRDIRGIDLETQNIEFLDSCSPGEDEVVFEIRGKELLELTSFIKSKEQQAT